MIMYVISDIKTRKDKKVVMYHNSGKIEMTPDEAYKSFPNKMKEFGLMNLWANIAKENK